MVGHRELSRLQCGNTVKSAKARRLSRGADPSTGRTLWPLRRDGRSVVELAKTSHLVKRFFHRKLTLADGHRPHGEGEEPAPPSLGVAAEKPSMTFGTLDETRETHPNPGAGKGKHLFDLRTNSATDFPEDGAPPRIFMYVYIQATPWVLGSS